MQPRRLRHNWCSSSRVALTVSLAVLVLACSPGVANASPPPTFPDACGSVNNFDYADCERLDFLATEVGGQGDQMELVWWGVWINAGLLTLLVVQPYWDRLFNWWRNPT